MGSAVLRVVVEAGARDAGNTDFFHEILGEANVPGSRRKARWIRIRKPRYVGHDVVGAARFKDREAGMGEDFPKARSLFCVARGQFVVVGLRRFQRNGPGLLQRRGSANRQKVVHLADGIGEIPRRQHPAHAPPCHGISFAHTVDQDGALPHAWKRQDGNMHGAIVEDVLVDFVGDAVGVPANAEIADEFEFAAREHFSGGIVGRVEDDGFCLGTKGRREFVFIVGPHIIFIPRWTHFHEPRSGPAQDRVRPVILVIRLENHDFVARIDDGHHGGHHGFRRTTANRDLAFGIDANALGALEFFDDGVAQWFRAPGNRVLIDVVRDRLAGGFFYFGRRGEIRKSLRKIYGVVFQGQPRHLANYGFGELFSLGREHAPSDLRHRGFRSGHGREESLASNAKNGKN